MWCNAISIVCQLQTAPSAAQTSSTLLNPECWISCHSILSGHYSNQMISWKGTLFFLMRLAWVSLILLSKPLRHGNLLWYGQTRHKSSSIAYFMAVEGQVLICSRFHEIFFISSRLSLDLQILLGQFADAVLWFDRILSCFNDWAKKFFNRAEKHLKVWSVGWIFESVSWCWLICITVTTSCWHPSIKWSNEPSFDSSSQETSAKERNPRW